MASIFDYLNPADPAMGYLNRIKSTISPYYKPYINQGNKALDILMGQYNQLINNPGDLMSRLASGYEKSPGYQFNMNQAMNAVNNAAAAGGMLGTPYHQQNAATLASNLASQDYNNYLSNILGLYGGGLSGYGGISQMGYGASNELANSLGNLLMNKANLSYLGQANQNQQSSNLFNQILGGIGAIGGGLLSFL